MNSAPHLLVEDQPEFERVLDDVLHTVDRRPDLTAEGRQRLDHEQLRNMALAAAVPIAARAAPEYQAYLALRQELRELDPDEHASAASPETATSARTSTVGGDVAADDPGSAEGDTPATRQRDRAAQLGLTGAVSAGLGDTAGAGVLAVVSVLAPLLAGAAAVIFLLVGYSLQLVTPEPSLAGALRTAGWVFALLAAATALAGMTGVLLAAVRNSGTDPDATAQAPDPRTRLTTAVGEAEEAWREALLERAILPFLREAVTDPRTALDAFDAGHLVPYEPQRTPRLGYSQPDYSSPADGAAEDTRSGTHGGAAGGTEAEPPQQPATGTRPRFASPDYSSPDYGGPEHEPDRTTDQPDA